MEEETGAMIETNESKEFDLGKATIKDAFEPVDNQECLSNSAETSGGSLRQLSIQLVILQRFKEGDLADLSLFDSKIGLTWKTNGNRTRHLTDYEFWKGKRGATGKLPPNGFPRPARFT